jgi:tetratricopeptide (TPR) repeat protein
MLGHFIKRNFFTLTKQIIPKAFNLNNTRLYSNIIFLQKRSFSKISREQAYILLDDLTNLVNRSELMIAVEKAQHAVELLRDKPEFTNEHFQALTILTQIYSELDRDKESIELLQAYLNGIDKIVLGNSNLNDSMKVQIVIAAKDKLAYYHGKLKDFKTARQFIDENINQLEEAVGLPGTQDNTITTLAVAYINLFQLQVGQGDSLEEQKKNLEKAYRFLNKHQDVLGQFGFFILKNLGYLNQIEGEFEKAIELYQEALGLAEITQQMSDQDLYEIHVYLGNCYEGLDEYEKSVSEITKAIDVKKTMISKLRETDPAQHTHHVELGNLYQLLAEMHFELNDDNKALEYIMEGKKYNLKFPTQQIYMARSYFILANIYYNKKFNEKCIENAKKYIKAIDSADETSIEQSGYNVDVAKMNRYKCFKMICECYYNLKDTEKCKKYVNITINLMGDIKDDGLFVEKYEIARLNYLNGEFDKSVEAYQDVMNTINENPEEGEEAENQYLIFDCRYNIGIIKSEQGKLEEAKEIFSGLLSDIVAGKLEVDESFKEELNKKIVMINMRLKNK